jgi:hypothetical protein
MAAEKSTDKQVKQAVMAFLCEHPDLDKYIEKAFPEGRTDNLGAVYIILAQKQAELTKQDFFTPDDNNKFIINSAGGWKNFERISALLEKRDEKFVSADFTKALGSEGSVTLLGSAGTHNALEKIFSSQLWQGRYDEMESLWYVVSPMVRRASSPNGGEVPLSLKRALFALEGKTIPEDNLAKSGLTPADVRNAFIAKGNFEGLNHKLEQAGDYLRKEYLLLKNSAGNTVFHEASAWGYYDKIVKTLKAHGEQLEEADFIHAVARNASILTRAAENNALHKVFAPEHWENRLGDMLQLWSNVRPGWKVPPLTTSDFDSAYAAAESKTYAPALRALTVKNKLDVMSPLNVPSATEKPVLFLGLDSFWNNFAEIQKKTDLSLTLSDLRLQSGQQGNSCLMQAAKLGHFDKVAAIAKDSGEKIRIEDFMAKDNHGRTLLNVLEDRNELALAFTPAIWVGRSAEMKILWAQVGVAARKQVDFGRAEVAVHQATLKQQKPGFKFKRPPAA